MCAQNKLLLKKKKVCLSVLFLGDHIFSLLQYWKTSNKKYVSTYLFFHIGLRGFGDF